MRLIRVAFARVRGLFRRNAIAAEIRDEMQFHVEMRADEYQKDGMTPETARRVATKRFGNLAVMHDRGYDVRGGGVLETIWQDVRYTIRSLRRERGFAAITILTLAVAMGASTALFSIIDVALLRPVPYANPEEIVGIGVTHDFGDGRLYEGVAPSFDDLERWHATGAFASIGQARVGNSRLIVDAGMPERITVSRISEGFLDVYGVSPLLGRGFTRADTLTGAPAVALVSHSYWRSRLHADPAALESSIRVDGKPVVIVGVLPAGFYDDSAVWQPMVEPSARMRSMRASGTPSYGRLRHGLSLAEAAILLNASERTREAAFHGVNLESLYEETVRRYRPAMGILAGAVVLILLIACINVAGLMLARGAAREGELAVRAAMGAGRLRLIRQLLTESLTIAAAGGFGGVFLAWLVLDGLVAVLPLSLPDNVAAEINWRVLAFGLALTIITSTLVGLLPAIRLSRTRLGLSLSKAGRQRGSALTKRGGQLLIAAEVALALILLTGTGLMLSSLTRALSVDVGFDPRAFVTMEVFPVDTSESVQAEYFPALIEAVRRLPGVSAAGAIDYPPLSQGAGYTDVEAEGREIFAAVKDVFPGYFEAVGLVPLQGRLPTDADYAKPSVVLSADAARRLFPDSPAVGRHLTNRMSKHTWSVAAVVPDIRSRSALETDTRPDVYFTYQPADFAASDAASRHVPTVVVGTSGANPELAEHLRHAATSIGSDVIVERIRSGSDWFGDNVEEVRHRTLLLGLIGGLGLALTLVGIVGVTAYAVTRRTREIGVRMAFGARPIDVVRRILADTIWPIAVGIATGLLGAYYASRFVESFLYETGPRDVSTFTIVTCAMVVVALVAAWIPARRAASIDPVVALRSE